MNEIQHKKGATFSYAGLVKLPAGTWSAACELHNGAMLVETLTATLTALGALGPEGETHSLLIEAQASNTANWPIAKLKGDIVFSAASLVIATNTFHVLVQQGVTNA